MSGYYNAPGCRGLRMEYEVIVGMMKNTTLDVQKPAFI